MGFYLLTVKEGVYSINRPHSDSANEVCAIPHWMQRMQGWQNWQKDVNRPRQRYSIFKVIKGLKTYRAGDTAALLARGTRKLACLSALQQEAAHLPPG